MSICIRKYGYIRIVSDEAETEAVRLAITQLKRDFYRVLDCNIDSAAKIPAVRIHIGTTGVSGDSRLKAAAERAGRAGRDGLLSGSAEQAGTEGSQSGSAERAGRKLRTDWRQHREAYAIWEDDGELMIMGTDRRGTIYGIYEFCRSFLGVSPWYFFADVPIRQKDQIFIDDHLFLSDYPTVEYRGIFVNDEEELEHWVCRYMGEATIGVKTYEKLFELLLRLKLNYIWPAMHVNSFNAVRENGELADRMGIVVGTSHCDMLMRSNNREWKPWLLKKGYTDVEYDFSIPGRNREILKEYWRESIEQNREFEVCYTLGMRGIHDSGFETKSLKGKQGEELVRAKIDLLDSVIRTQQDMLTEVLGHEPLKIFVPYKEVLELYDHGLEVPEDLTLIWVNDNYGYIRRYPNEEEKNRKGGNGIYYHNSYWAPPGGSYLFICSIPLAHTRNELTKAYEEGIRKLWVCNFGAVKPLEQQITYYADLAWEAGKADARTDDEQRFLVRWIDETFSGNFGGTLAPVLTEFDQLTNVRKIEQMDMDAFSQEAYGDEAAARIHRYKAMFDTANRVYRQLPEQEKDAFFQLILMKIHAAYYTNVMYYYADRSNLCMRQGKYRAAARYTKQSKQFDFARRCMLHYYNHVMANGKWNGMLTPEDFPPPRTAMEPACMPPLSIGEQKLIVTVWNQEKGITFVQSSVKWFELANAGEGSIRYRIQAPEWIILSETGEREEAAEWAETGGQDAQKGNPAAWRKEPAIPAQEERTARASLVGSVEAEKRILVQADWAKAKVSGSADRGAGAKGESDFLSGEIFIEEWGGNVTVIPVTVCLAEKWADGKGVLTRVGRKLPFEDGGRIVVEAESSKPQSAEAGADPSEQWEGTTGWKFIANLGRGKGSLAEAREQGAVLAYSFVCTDGEMRTEENGEAALLEVHRFPTLNSTGRIRVGVSLDGGSVRILESSSTDEHCGSWKENVRNNVDKLYLELPRLKPGVHHITFHAVDRYFAFSRFVIYTTARKDNNLGYAGEDQGLPKDWDILRFAENFYGKESLQPSPRPVLYLPVISVGDSLTMEDIIMSGTEETEEHVTPAMLVAQGNRPVSEEQGAVRIEAASALAQSPYAYTGNFGWDYCLSPAHGGTGLAMYIRAEGRRWETPEQAPSLNYRVKLRGGNYRIWVRVHMWGTETSRFTIGIDGMPIAEQDLYGGKPIWRYSNEQVWKWIPVFTTDMAEGEHLITVYSLVSRLRFEKICLISVSDTASETPELP